MVLKRNLTTRACRSTGVCARVLAAGPGRAPETQTPRGRERPALSCTLRRFRYYCYETSFFFCIEEGFSPFFLYKLV